jgi:hypothetical protein
MLGLSDFQSGFWEKVPIPHRKVAAEVTSGRTRNGAEFGGLCSPFLLTSAATLVTVDKGHPYHLAGPNLKSRLFSRARKPAVAPKSIASSIWALLKASVGR